MSDIFFYLKKQALQRITSKDSQKDINHWKGKLSYNKSNAKWLNLKIIFA